MRARRLLFGMVLVLGCRGAQAEPEEALRRFLNDLRTRRADAAWAALSAGTRNELVRRHEVMARAAGKPSEPLPARILYDELGLMLLSPPENVAIVSPPGAELILRVTVKDGPSADLKLVREGAEWKVDLLSSLRDAPPLDAALKGPAKPAPDDGP